MLPERLKGILGGAKRHAPASAGPAVAGTRSFISRNSDSEPVIVARTSRGLEEFFSYIRGQSGLTILDFGPATQQNVTFITNLGHRLYSEDFLKVLHETFGVNDTVDQSNPAASNTSSSRPWSTPWPFRRGPDLGCSRVP